MGLSQADRLVYVLISHNLAVVEQLCEETAVLYLGRIVEHGPTEKILARPAHPYTLALRSAVPEIDLAARRSRIVLPGTVPDPANPRPHTRSIHDARTRSIGAEPSCRSSGWSMPTESSAPPSRGDPWRSHPGDVRPADQTRRGTRTEGTVVEDTSPPPVGSVLWLGAWSRCTGGGLEVVISRPRTSQPETARCSRRSSAPIPRRHGRGFERTPRLPSAGSPLRRPSAAPDPASRWCHR